MEKAENSIAARKAGANAKVQTCGDGALSSRSRWGQDPWSGRGGCRSTTDL